MTCRWMHCKRSQIMRLPITLTAINCFQPPLSLDTTSSPGAPGLTIQHARPTMAVSSAPAGAAGNMNIVFSGGPPRPPGATGRPVNIVPRPPPNLFQTAAAGSPAQRPPGSSAQQQMGLRPPVGLTALVPHPGTVRPVGPVLPRPSGASQQLQQRPPPVQNSASAAQRPSPPRPAVSSGSAASASRPGMSPPVSVQSVGGSRATCRSDDAADKLDMCCTSPTPSSRHARPRRAGLFRGRSLGCARRRGRRRRPVPCCPRGLQAGPRLHRQHPTSSPCQVSCMPALWLFGHAARTLLQL